MIHLTRRHIIAFIILIIGIVVFLVATNINKTVQTTNALTDNNVTQAIAATPDQSYLKADKLSIIKKVEVADNWYLADIRRTDVDENDDAAIFRCVFKVDGSTVKIIAYSPDGIYVGDLPKDTPDEVINGVNEAL